MTGAREWPSSINNQPPFAPVIILLMLFPLSRWVTHQSCLPVLTSTRSWVENSGNKAPRAPTSAWYHSKQSRSVSWSLTTMPDFCVWVVVQQLCQAYLWAINSGSQYNGKERCGRTALWEIWWAVARIVIYALYFHTEDNLRYDRNLRSYLEIAWLRLYEQFNIRSRCDISVLCHWLLSKWRQTQLLPCVTLCQMC